MLSTTQQVNFILLACTLLILNVLSPVRAASSSQTISTTTTYSPTSTYSSTITITQSYTSSWTSTWTNTMTGTWTSTETGSITGTITATYTETLTLPPPSVSNTPNANGVQPPNLVFSFSTSLTNYLGYKAYFVAECASGVKNQPQQCQRYLNPINKCCTKTCQFAFGGTVCKNSNPCYKKARCTAYGVCRGRNRRRNYASCSAGACYSGVCTSGIRPVSRMKLKKLLEKRRKMKEMDLNLESLEESEDGEDYSSEIGFLADVNADNEDQPLEELQGNHLS